MDVGDLPGVPGASVQSPGDAVSSVRWWTPSATLGSTNTAPVSSASANTDLMNQSCRVCGEPAAGFHFGAFTCEGCKSFFGRTYNNLGSISECKNGGVCVINKKNRTACKACRLRKCLTVGMSKSGSRYGRRSNWFKIHCLLQEQSHQVQQTRLKGPKLPYDKSYNNNNNNNPSDAVNNNISSNNNHNNSSNNNNNNNNNVNSSSNNNNNNGATTISHERSFFGKREDVSCTIVQRTQDLLRQPEVFRPQELLRPDPSRFPMWRGPAFFHSALTHMQLLGSPFFPFQQRFVVPYVNPMSLPQTIPSLSSFSSDSVTPRSTPSPKLEELRVDAPLTRVDHQLASCDKSVAFLRSLGPEQEAPIDLSMKTTRDIRSDDRSPASENDKTSNSDEEDVEEAETGPALDLTRKP